MNIPWYKKALSYVIDLQIESLKTELHPVVDVFLSKGRLLLSSENAVYSYGDLYKVYRKGLKKIKIDWEDVNDILILGFGLGSIPIILDKMQSEGLIPAEKQFNILAVDLEEMFFQLHKKYKVNTGKAFLEMVTADAGQFMEMNERKFDLIFVDVFEDNMIPDSLLQKAFIDNLASALNENGLILWNHMISDWAVKGQFDGFLEDCFMPVFPDAAYVKINNNNMLMNRDVVFSVK